ncbi:hypothetical protein OG439_14330 [Amycolatopsis sp. NBC_01307]|uniref:hypothetical protein n=1 Tax=Amycolatopsis sp. NBC_01307 TaxID=2903561 RepID=UPI002E125A8A|nr:hypothetical protein OG439_14330 [Amycolatopsis sp. NBC_01307]
MSFDLYIWRERHPITDERAAELCRQLGDGRDDVVDPDARVLAFRDELAGRFPDLESLSVDELESSPWAMSPDATPRRVILCMSWSRLDGAVSFVLELAGRHGLVCFDPQSQRVHNPQTAAAGGLRLQCCDGSRIDDPSRDDLHLHLRRLSAENWHATLERRPGWFVQVGIGQYAGNVPPGKFAVEYREGEPDLHYRVLVGTLDEVMAVFDGFAVGDEAWKTTHPWTKY